MFDGHKVGYFCRTMDELSNLVTRSDALFDPVRYREFQEGLRSLRVGRAPSELTTPDRPNHRREHGKTLPLAHVGSTARDGRPCSAIIESGTLRASDYVSFQVSSAATMRHRKVL